MQFILSEQEFYPLKKAAEEINKLESLKSSMLIVTNNNVIVNPTTFTVNRTIYLDKKIIMDILDITDPNIEIIVR